MGAQGLHGTLELHRVPQHDGGGEQIQATGPVALLLKAPVPDFTQLVEEDGPGQRVAGFAFVEPDLHTAAQVHALQPIQDE